MPSACAVADCENTAKCDNYSDHSFPVKNEELCKQWVRLCKRKVKFNPKHARICSVHFTPDDYERDLRNELLGLPPRRKLKWKEAVPSIFPGRAGKSQEEVSARNERALKRKWVLERKAIVQELLNRVEEEEEEEDVQDYNNVNCDDDPLETWEPPRIRTPSPPPPEPEPDYFELTMDDFRSKVDSLWQVLSFKNKKISLLEHRIDELENVLKHNKLEVTWVVPETRQDAPGDPLGDEDSKEQQNSGCPISKDVGPNIDKSEENAIIKIENSLTEFCQYNKIHLQTLDVIKSEDGRLNLVEECRTKIPSVRLERTEYTEYSNMRATNTSCFSPVEFDTHHHDDGDQEMPGEELPVELRTKWIDSVTKVLYSYRCNKCMEVCPSLEAILHHNQKEHKGVKAVEACSLCKTCGSGKYENHLRYKCHQTSTKASFVRFIRKAFNPALKNSDDSLKRKWKCEKCNETFTTAKDKSLHRQVVHSRFANKWKCGRCEEEFTAMYKLRIHMKEAHKESPPNRWKCEECEEAFPSMRSRMMHMKEKHKTETLPEKTCPHCNRIIRGRYQYKIHIQRHVGERSFLCSQCGFATRSKLLLAGHTERVHGDAETEYPHICMYCGRAYKSKSGLKWHERVHADGSKYTCPICHKVVAGLKCHIDEVHNMVRKYACHLCDKRYKRRSALNDHLVRFHKQPKNTLTCYPYSTKGGETPEEETPTKISSDKKPETTVKLVEENQEEAGLQILDKQIEQVVKVATEYSIEEKV